MEDSKNLTKQLNELSEITQWFENQEEIDVEEGLNKVKDAVSLIKASKARLSEIENEFKTIEKDIKVEENKLEYINAINELRVEIVKQFGEYKRDIGVIQTKIERKSVAIGALAGFIPALITALFFLLK